ncbi:MAG TPA: GNAT family N-acetyltransferase [Pseudonocardiaceae bacterium]|nr:GNAT family N-acetyltransferase [Pseudonocardiaceae bacterium]
MTADGWTVARTLVHDPVVVDLLRRYFTDVASSFYGRPATDAEVTAALAEDPSDDLVPPGGAFFVAHYQDIPAGCVGLRFGAAGFAELTRMFVTPEARGRGGSAVLLAVAERHAKLGEAHTMRLETRLDLVAARRLYTKHGYRPIPAYSTGPFAECWYAKDLR